MMRTLLMTALFAPLADAQGPPACVGAPAQCLHTNPTGAERGDTAAGWSWDDYYMCRNVNDPYSNSLSDSTACDAVMTDDDEDDPALGACTYIPGTVAACDAIEDLEDSTACDAVLPDDDGHACSYFTCPEYYAARWMDANEGVHETYCDAMGDAMGDDYDVEGCTRDDRNVLNEENLSNLFDTERCTLEPTADFGVTPGTCTAVGAMATCEYAEGTFSASGQDGVMDTTDVPDSCTSTLVGVAAECLACIEVGDAAVAAKALRACTPEPDDVACADDLESPECRACVAKRITANITDGIVPGGSTLCEYAPGVDASGDEYWLGEETSLEECAQTILAMFPDPADRENMAMTWDYDCDLEEGECWDDCYVELGVDREEWDAEAAEYADYTEEDILGNEWHSCYFNATYDEAAAIAEAEAACGYGSQTSDDEEPDKTSGGLAVTASIGMIINAMAVSMW
jgi:hypothetical protein